MVSKDKKSQPDEIEDWDEIEEVDLSKKRYISDETRAIHSKTTKEKWAKGIYDSQRLNNEILIERFREVHGDKYDYSKIDYDYKQRDKHLIIICPVLSGIPSKIFSILDKFKGVFSSAFLTE